MDHDSQVSGLVIGCAIEVHKQLGPGLKESAYKAALRALLTDKKIRFVHEVTIPVIFNGVRVGDYRPDLIVEETVVVEIKSVDVMLPLFTSQMITYLKVTNLRVGLILNFNRSKMTDGIKRVVL